MAFTKLTCVHYNQEDLLGKLLAYIALLPIFIVVHHASLTYSRRELHELGIFGGLVLNEAVARGLKHYLRHARPKLTCEALDLCHSFGMPSSHTQCMFFAATVHLFLLARKFSQKSRVTQLLGAVEVAGISVAAVLTAISRVYLGYHSIDQVVAAAILGMLLACICAMLLLMLGSRLDKVAAWPLLRGLGFKNTWDIPDPVAFEQNAYSHAKLKNQ